MPEYIEREALLEHIEQLTIIITGLRAGRNELAEFAIRYKNSILRGINDFPAADVAPVVRCKECKHGEIDDPDFPDQYYCHEGCGWNKGDFYCSYGDRGTQEGENENEND